LVWRYATGEYSARSAIIAHDLVYVTGGTLRALDLATGTLRWQAPIHANASATAWDGQVAVLGMRDGVHILDAHQGTLLRHLPSRGLMASVCYAHHQLYWLASDRILRAADAQTGALLWTYPYQHQSLITPAADQQRVYAVDWHRVYALDAATGTVQWEWTFSGALASVKDTLAVYDDMLLVPAVTVRIVALDAQCGQERWRSASAAVTSAVAVTADHVYATLKYLCALDRQTGALVWVHDAANPRPNLVQLPPLS
jgi:outer membrane protein assembly factor BamB